MHHNVVHHKSHSLHAGSLNLKAEIRKASVSIKVNSKICESFTNLNVQSQH